MNLLAQLPQTQIYYIGVGTAEGNWVLDSSEINQQYPQFLQKYPKMSKTVVLIDERLENPCFLHNLLVTRGKYTVLRSDPNIFILERDGVLFNLVTIRCNNIIRRDTDNYTPESYEFLGFMISIAISCNALLFYHDFSGQPVNELASYYDSLNLNNKIVFSITNRVESGCSFINGKLSDIKIADNEVSRSVWTMRSDELYQMYISLEDPSLLLQIANRVYLEAKVTLYRYAYEIDYLCAHPEQEMSAGLSRFLGNSDMKSGFDAYFNCMTRYLPRGFQASGSCIERASLLYRALINVYDFDEIRSLTN